MASSKNDSMLSDDDWNPEENMKQRSRKPVRRIISDSDDTAEDSSSDAELVPGTDEEEEEGGKEGDGETSDADTAIIEGSFEEDVEQKEESPSTSATKKRGSLSSSASKKRGSLSNSATKERESTTSRKASPRELQVVDKVKGKSPRTTHVTSTPMISGLKKPTPLDITCIPSTLSNFNATVAQEEEEDEGDSWDEYIKNPIPSKKSPPKTGGVQAKSSAKSVPPSSTAWRKGSSSSGDDEAEDMLVAGLNDITMKGAKEFTFKSTNGSVRPKPGAAGATSLDFFDEDDEKEQSISANFDFDSGNGDSDIQILPNETRTKAREVVTLEDSEDELAAVIEKVKKIPLGEKPSNKEQPKKAIFLNEPPPLEKKTYAYDPTNAKHQSFYGDVQRTITMMAKTLEEMPTKDDEEEVVLPKGLVPLFDHQLHGLRWLSWREREFPGGGILADEMGLGKTIMIIALIMKSKMETQQHNAENWIDTEEVGNHIPCKSTLVVCPVGCLDQWREEIHTKGKGLRVYTFHGNDRKCSAATLAQYDVVLTTYHTIRSEIPKDTLESNMRSALKRLYWRRIVLDEAHNIRNPKTGCALAICQLKARHRWAVTGTPVHNRPEDLYSFVKFLKMKPFDDPKCWDFWIGMKAVRKASDALNRLHILSKTLVLRRTKLEVQEDGGNVQKIPPKTVEIVEVELSESERKVYDYLMRFCESMASQFVKEKEQREMQLNAAAMIYTAERRKKKPSSSDDLPTDIRFSHLFALLVRLRQCAVMPYLIHTMLEEEEVDEDISFDADDDNHLVSKINPVFDRMYESTKVLRILEDLETLRKQAKTEERPMDKVVVISSWTSTLEILYEHLRRRKFSCVFITGKDNTNDRTDSLKKFNNYPERYHVCLLSLMAGGVGLNLVGGNHVFFMEPHWNPQLELQAQDRVHRFGQKKNVIVKRYIASDTVESKILAIQDGKMDLADGVLNSAKAKKGSGLSLHQLMNIFQT